MLTPGPAPRARAPQDGLEDRRPRAEAGNSWTSGAARARWSAGAKPIEASHAGTLTIGDLVLPCAVLPGERRVLSETGVLNSLGMYRSGAVHVRARDAASGGRAHLPLFAAHKNLQPFVDDELAAVLGNPVWYIPPDSGTKHKGVDATLIPKICDVWLKARDSGVLKGRRQILAATRADMLIRGLAQVGIIALIDEATGFQDDRPRRALAKILEAFIAKELQPWVQTFPADFYREIFRLRGLEELQVRDDVTPRDKQNAARHLEKIRAALRELGGA